MDQTPPRGDNRYRTHRSVKCYVAELMVGTSGATWYLNESAQRVVHLFSGEIEKVVYKNRFHPCFRARGSANSSLPITSEGAWSRSAASRSTQMIKTKPSSLTPSST